MTDRKKPTAGFWITVALVAVCLLALYVLSIGPAYRFVAHPETPDGWHVAYRLFYWPILWAYDNGPTVVEGLISWYVHGFWG